MKTDVKARINGSNVRLELTEESSSKFDFIEKAEIERAMNNLFDGVKEDLSIKLTNFKESNGVYMFAVETKNFESETIRESYSENNNEKTEKIYKDNKEMMVDNIKKLDILMELPDKAFISATETNEKEIEKFAKSENSEERLGLVFNEKTTLETLDKMAQTDPSEKVREAAEKMLDDKAGINDNVAKSMKESMAQVDKMNIEEKVNNSSSESQKLKN